MEAKEARMKRLPAKALNRGLQRFRQGFSLGQEAPSIDVIPHKRMADMRHVHADLVRAAGLQTAGDKRSTVAKTLFQGVVRQCAAPAGAGDRLPSAVSDISVQGSIDRADMGFRHPPNKGVVLAKEHAIAAVPGELHGKGCVRGVILGDDENAGRILVEPVDDPRPFDAADAGKTVSAMRDERVDQRPAAVSSARMHHKPGRLVDDDDVCIFVEDFERDILRLRLCGRGRRNLKDDVRPSSEARVRVVQNLAAQAYLAVLDERLQTAPRKPFSMAREESVEPVAGRLGLDQKRALL